MFFSAVITVRTDSPKQIRSSNTLHRNGFEGAYTYTTINYRTAQKMKSVRGIDEQLHKSHGRINGKGAHNTSKESVDARVTGCSEPKAKAAESDGDRKISKRRDDKH